MNLAILALATFNFTEDFFLSVLDPFSQTPLITTMARSMCVRTFPNVLWLIYSVWQFIEIYVAHQTCALGKQAIKRQ